jgi:hypothetical protein
MSWRGVIVVTDLGSGGSRVVTRYSAPTLNQTPAARWERQPSLRCRRTSMAGQCYRDQLAWQRAMDLAISDHAATSAWPE